MMGISVVDIKYRSLIKKNNNNNKKKLVWPSFKTACFILLNPKHQKQEQKYLGRTKITLAMKGAHMQHTL